MLSILIPCYNYDVTALVTELHHQATSVDIEFEILIFDDGSQSELNKINSKLNRLNSISFVAHPLNVGLSSNRNLLIKASKFNYLLLIDADMLIVNSHYIANYLEEIKKTSEVVYGGILYSDEPKEKQYLLRWLYGKKHETKSVNERYREPYKSIFSSNLLIMSSLAKSILYETRLIHYGYEDTLFAHQLKHKKSKITHIDNPVLHNDHTTNKQFISKTNLALNNLKYLIIHNLIDANYTSLGSAWALLKKLRLTKIVVLFYNLCGKTLEKQLVSERPSLNIFKLYKLSYFCFINQDS